MTDEAKNEYIIKKTLVKEVSKVICSYIPTIKELDYVIFEGDYEYLTITYKGNGFACRNCTGNSLNGILKEITQLTYGGYYEEVPIFQKLKETKKEIALKELGGID